MTPRRRRLLLPVVLAGVALVGCTNPPASAPQEAAAPAPSGSAPSGSSSGPTADPESVTVTVGEVGPVTAEVADTAQERAVGLMRRPSVPLGTGMVFLYDEPSTGRFYMFDVAVPLTAIFASAGTVVGVVDMPPCPLTDPAACPTYGPDVAYDTVLETAPETVRGKVSVGDALTVVR